MTKPERIPPPPRRRSFTLRSLFVVVSALGAVAALTLYYVPLYVSKARESSWRAQCHVNLLDIAHALQNYKGNWGRFPPAVVRDAAGAPMHSWRVLIAPYLPESPRLRAYDESQPWDSATNRRALLSWPSPRRVFQCPSNGAIGAGSARTDYLMIVPRGDARGATGVNEEMVVVVEVGGSGILWTEPRDLVLDELNLAVNTHSAGCICSGHIGGAMVLCADGNVRFIEEGSERAAIAALLGLQSSERPAGRDSDR